MTPQAKAPAPLNYIRSFECSARHLSFTEAAAELGYTQAAISNHVRALEKYLGHQLFIRYPRSLKLTEIGEAFLPMLREALGQIDFATEAVLASARNRTVVISCPTSLAENWLAKAVSAFSRKNREIEILVHGIIWEQPAEPIADVSIVIRRDDNKPAFSRQLWEDRLVMVCAPALLEGKEGISKPDDLLRANWIAIHGRQEFWPEMAAALDIDAARNDKRLSTNSTNIALELAASGAGCLVTTWSMARLYIGRGLLAEPFTVRPPSRWGYYLMESPATKGPVARKVRDWLLAEAHLFAAEIASEAAG